MIISCQLSWLCFQCSGVDVRVITHCLTLMSDESLITWVPSSRWLLVNIIVDDTLKYWKRKLINYIPLSKAATQTRNLFCGKGSSCWERIWYSQVLLMQRSPYVVTKGWIFSCLDGRNSVNKHFIKWLPLLFFFLPFCTNLWSLIITVFDICSDIFQTTRRR